MSETLVVGPFEQARRTNRLPFAIDNDNFPVLTNAYQWRGRVKRKRGTSFLGRLQWTIGATDGSGNAVITIDPHPILSGIVSFVVGSQVFYDPGGASPVALITNGLGTASLNRSTGVLTITGSNLSTNIIYYPTLPVMGLEDLLLDQTSYAGTIGFDTTYAYNIPTTQPFTPYSISKYKNPSTGTYTNYVDKITGGNTQTPLWWNGEDYQQFWTANYQGAFWATNGIQTNPILLSSIGMQFSPPADITAVTRPSSTTLQMTIASCPLVIGDFVFLNEWTAATPANAGGINFQTGYITACAPNTPALAAKTVTITFPNATIAADTYTPGIVQYLTTRKDTTKDCIRWYDGDPTTPGSTLGWVNFTPPLFSSSTPLVSLDGLERKQYYLVQARLILNFKDRLMFFGPVVQASTGSPIYLQDTVIYSQNGTPFYTASFTGSVTSPKTLFNPILVPTNETGTPNAYFSNVTGYGGFVVAGVQQPIITVGANQDSLVLGFGGNLQTKMIYTGNDILPFEIYITNSEMSSASTFSIVVMNEGIITRGNRGYIVTDQVGSRRIDLLNPDQAFEIKLPNNGAERFTAQRDFINEWIYFTYPSNLDSHIYPTRTFLYNYRDESWAVFKESYTTYGQFRVSSGFTWQTLSVTWNSWNDPWDSGDITLLQPQVIAGNQQGFIVFRADESTTESESLTIQNIVAQVISSPNHCLNIGDFIIIEGCLGDIGDEVNGKIFEIVAITIDTVTVGGFVITETYIGGGTIKRMYVPLIQTRQFPPSWGLARKTRIGTQQYLLTKTPKGQITVQIYLSQNDNNVYNNGSIVPSTSPSPENNSLIYSQVVSTSPDFYKNNVIRASLGTIGNGITTSFSFDYPAIFSYENEGLVPGSVTLRIGTIATFTDDGLGGFTATGTGTSVGSSIDYSTSIVTIAFSVAPSNQLALTNFQYYYEDIQNPTASQQQQIWHRMNTCLLGDTVQLGFTLSDEQMTQTDLDGEPINGFSEIELHGFIMDLSESSLLA